MYSYNHKYISQSPPVSSLPPWSISKAIKLLMHEVVDKYTDHPQPFLFLSDSEPYVFAPWIDASRANQAFDRLAIPILKKNLLTEKTNILISQALCLLCDLVHDPEKACEALRLNITSPLVRLMSNDNMFIRQKVLMLLNTLASAPYGRVILTKNKYIMMQLKRNLNDEEELIRSQAYRTLNTLSSNWFGVSNLLELKFLPLVMNSLKQEMSLTSNNQSEYIKCLLETLKNLIESNDEVRIESIRYDIFELKALLNHSCNRVQQETLNVFNELFKMRIGRKGALAHKFYDYLVLDEHNPDEKLQTQIMSALMFTTVETEAKKDAVNKGYLDICLNIILNPNCYLPLKRNAAKMLTNLAELPICRHKLRKNIASIVQIPTQGDESFERCLTSLINVMMWEP